MTIVPASDAADIISPLQRTASIVDTASTRSRVPSANRKPDVPCICCPGNPSKLPCPGDRNKQKFSPHSLPTERTLLRGTTQKRAGAAPHQAMSFGSSRAVRRRSNQHGATVAGLLHLQYRKVCTCLIETGNRELEIAELASKAASGSSSLEKLARNRPQQL